MLHLDARVHLQEVEVAVPREQKLAGAGVDVSRRARGSDRRVSHALAQIRSHRHARGLLDHLLVATLHRTLALAECEAVPVLVSEHLDLDVPRPLDVLLDVDRVIAERVLRLALRRRERARDLRLRMDDAHPLPAAACRRLEQHRIAERRGDLGGLLGVAQRRRGPRHHRRARRDRQRARRDLRAHRFDRLGRGAHPDQPRIANGAREPGPFREEAVPRMDRVGADLLRDFDEMFAAQIALRRRGGSDADGFIRFAHMGRLRIGVGVDRDRADPQFAAGAHDAHRDLAAIRDQHLLDRARARLHRGMHPCFLAGFRIRFPWSASSASISRGRVSRGSMMSSTYPRPAAT